MTPAWHSTTLPVLLLAGSFAACDQFEDPDIGRIRSIAPDSGAVGALVVIQSENLFSRTTVVFEDDVDSPLAAVFVGDRIVTVVPRGAVSGPIRIETGGERGGSSADFRVVAAPPSTPAFFEDAVGTVATGFTGGCGASNPGDDGFVTVVLPFTFPFYGRPQTEMFVNVNGTISFGSPRPCDNDGDLRDLTTAAKISVLGIDLAVITGGQLFVNASDPAQAVVTWREVALCGLPETSHTLQAVLYPDGRIRLNYGYVSMRGLGTQCLSDRVTGSVVGIAPLAPSNVQTATFSAQPTLTIGPAEAVGNPFLLDRLFDLENRSLLFTPLTEGGVFGGYRIELI